MIPFDDARDTILLGRAEARLERSLSDALAGLDAAVEWCRDVWGSDVRISRDGWHISVASPPTARPAVVHGIDFMGWVGEAMLHRRQVGSRYLPSEWLDVFPPSCDCELHGKDS